MKQPLNEQFRRMQKLAGIIIQEAVNRDQLEVYADEGQVDTKATFVTISSKKSSEESSEESSENNVAKYDNFEQLVQGLQKMPPLRLESAENDLTGGDIANAKNLFQIAKAKLDGTKAKLDGTKNYKLIARASERDNLGNELYIWGTM